MKKIALFLTRGTFLSDVFCFDSDTKRKPKGKVRKNPNKIYYARR